MSISLISVLTFLCVSLCVAGAATLVFDLFLRDRSRVDQRLREEFSEQINKRATSSPLFKDLLGAPRDAAATGRPSLLVRCQTWIDQSGLPWTMTQVIASSALISLSVAAVTGLLTQSWLLTSISAVLLLPSPVVIVVVARSRRRALLCRQLPDAFDVMSRALKAGQTVPAAFQVISQDFPAPIAQEFAHCYEQQHLGVTQEVALRDLSRRAGIMELQMFAVAMIVHSRSGGNLAELLAKLAGLLRKRANIHNRVRALTGEGRMQAAILIALPAVVFAAMYFLNREYAEVLLGRPWLLGGCVLAQVIGAVCIYKIIQIDY